MEDKATTEQMPVLAEIIEREPARDAAHGAFREDRDKLATYISIGVVAVGFILMAGAWFGASGKNELQQQFPYLLSGAIPGLALALLGGGILVVRDIRRERDVLEERLNRLIEALETRPLTASAPTGNGQVVLGRTTFHLPDCRLIRGKNGLPKASKDEAIESGLSPCRTCSP